MVVVVVLTSRWKELKLVVEIVEIGVGGKGLRANKQFNPSLELVSSEALPRTALTVPTFGLPGSRFVVLSWISTTPLVLRQ